MDDLSLVDPNLIAMNILKGQRVESKIEEVFLLFLIRNKLEPIIIPVVYRWIVSRLEHRNYVLRESIVISKSWIYSEVFEFFGYHICNILHNLSIRIGRECANIMRNRVSSPKDKIWLSLLSNKLQHIKSSLNWNIT